jgi:hypothetical protein
MFKTRNLTLALAAAAALASTAFLQAAPTPTVDGMRARSQAPRVPVSMFSAPRRAAWPGLGHGVRHGQRLARKARNKTRNRCAHRG